MLTKENMIPGKLYKIIPPKDWDKSSGRFSKSCRLFFADATTNPNDHYLVDALYLNEEEERLFDNTDVPILFLGTIYSFNPCTNSMIKLWKFCVFKTIFYLDLCLNDFLDDLIEV